MRIEVLCTGDELLTGLTTDTNSPYFMGKLFALGEKVAYAQTVPDVREDITAAIREASARADAVLVSGGLGPTADDVTAECAAAAQGVPLIEDADVLQRMKARFAKRNIAFTPNNARQARIPQGAEVVHNPVGSAPMFVQRMGRCTLFYLPGVPREYRTLVDREVMPRLRALIDAQPERIFRAARLLKTVGLPESHLDARVAPLAELHPNISWGFRTHAPENHLKLLAHGKTQAEADAALQAAEDASRAVLHPHVFGQDEDTFPQAVVALLRTRGGKVALAESCTGGMVSELLTSVASASEATVGGAVVYTPELKTRFAGVRPETVAQHTDVSAEVALEMAHGIRNACHVEFGLSTTGYAGPTGGTPENPVGTVYCAVAGQGLSLCERHVIAGDRERVRQFASFLALDMLRRHLLEEKGTS